MKINHKKRCSKLRPNKALKEYNQQEADHSLLPQPAQKRFQKGNRSQTSRVQNRPWPRYKVGQDTKKHDWGARTTAVPKAQKRWDTDGLVVSEGCLTAFILGKTWNYSEALKITWGQGFKASGSLTLICGSRRRFCLVKFFLFLQIIASASLELSLQQTRNILGRQVSKSPVPEEDMQLEL